MKRYLIQLRNKKTLEHYPILYTYEVKNLKELRAKLNGSHQDHVDILAVEDVKDE